MRIAVTAGYGRSLHAIALIHELARRGHEVRCCLEVSTLEPARVRGYVRQLGWRILAAKVRARLGRGGGDLSDEVAPMRDFVRERGIASRTVAAACAAVGARHVVVRSLDAPRALDALRAAAPGIVVYAGGGILRPAFLGIPARGVLNVHGGPLPAFRGMNAAEWAVLHGVMPACTAHWVAEGIDTGPIVRLRPVPPDEVRSVSHLRGVITRAGVELMLETVEQVAANGDVSTPQVPGDGRLFRVMAAPLLEAVERRLARGGPWRDPTTFRFSTA